MLTGQIVLQLIVVLIAVQIFGFVCRRIGQQWVIGEILAGLALGPSLLGMLLPEVKNSIFPASTLPTLQTLGDIGLMLYMFSLGTHLDTHLMLRQSKVAAVTSLSSILLQLTLGAVLAFFLFPSLAGPQATLLSFMFMIGTAMAITAFPVLARLLTERKMLGTRIGTLALTCAAIDDVVAWCLLALVIAIAHAQGLPSVALTLGLTLLFIVCMFTIVRPFLAYAHRHIHSKQLLIALSITLLLLSAYCTNAIGIHPVFGAFLAGLILPRKALFVELVHSLDQVNTALFLPLYFVYSGLRTQIGLISGPSLWLICLLVLVIACLGKFSVGILSTRFLMKGSWSDSLKFGALMNTRGLVELIVLNIGLDLGILSPTLFAILVIMALVTTMMASPLLSLLDYKQRTSPKNSGDNQDESSLQNDSPENLTRQNLL